MSVELEDLIEAIVNNNNDVDEVLEALGQNWEIVDRLFYLEPENIIEKALDNASIEEIIDTVVTRDGVDVVFDYLLEQYKENLEDCITDNISFLEIKGGK